MNSLADSSLEEIKAAIRSEPWLLEHFDIGEKYIRTRSGRVYYSFAGLVPNQGKGAASARIEEARRLFPRIWFNADTTEGGRDALGWYHEKKDEQRGIGLGPDHDWSSHSADAFGLMCVVYEEPATNKRSDPRSAMAGGWMG